jgi:para-nitrobenzyl esterase
VDQLTEEGLQARLADPHTTSRYSLTDGGSFDPIEAVAVYRQSRTARGESTTPPELWSAIMTDRRFRMPMMRLAERHAAHTPQTYAYLFTWRSPGDGGRLGAAHGVEVPFVFGTLDAPELRESVPDGADVGQLSEQMQDAWLVFARSGSPRTPSLPNWDPYEVPQRCTMELGLTSAAVDAPYEAERRFWEKRVTN